MKPITKTPVAATSNVVGSIVMSIPARKLISVQSQSTAISHTIDHMSFRLATGQLRSVQYRSDRRTKENARHKAGHDERDGGAHAARAALFSASIRRASTQRK
jgi:hypothetical protein